MMNDELRKRILNCAHDNGHENYGEGNICVECRAKKEDIKEAQAEDELLQELQALGKFFRRIAELTLAIFDNKVIAAKDLGDALDEVDPEWRSHKS